MKKSNPNISIPGVKKEKGFTLLESIIAIVLVGFIAVGITPILQRSIAAFSSATSVNEVFQSARIGFNRMVNDLRMIDQSTSITSSDGTSISCLYYDHNSNLVPVTYNLSSGRLLRNTFTMVDNVSSFSITYYDDTGGSLTPPINSQTNVRRILVQMTVTATTGGKSSSIQFEESMAPRNFN